VHHFNIIADPAAHSKKEYMFGLVYSWEADAGGVLDAQRIMPGNAALPEDRFDTLAIAILHAVGCGYSKLVSRGRA
jgi:hypothetical protein